MTADGLLVDSELLTVLQPDESPDCSRDRERACYLGIIFAFPQTSKNLGRI
jgi:hypothetical protein